jgi:hypothetical protein
MTQTQLPKHYATLYPVDIRNALIEAGNARDMARIDYITDRLAERGIVRPRSDDSAPWRLQ